MHIHSGEAGAVLSQQLLQLQLLEVLFLGAAWIYNLFGKAVAESECDPGDLRKSSLVQACSCPLLECIWHNVILVWKQENKFPRIVGFCMISLQRAGVEELTLAVCLLPELGFAAVMSGGGAAETKTWLPHASPCTCSFLSCLVPRAPVGARHTPGRSSWFPTVFCEQSAPLASEICHLSTPAQIFALLI